MTQGMDVGFLELTWVPDNAAVAEPPADGYPVTLRFVSDDGEESLVTVDARVTPTFNDPPLFAGLEAVNVNLSASPFEFKRLRFDVVDPDRVAGGLEDVPDCAVDVWPVDDPGCSTACCADAFTDITCAPDGELDGDTWHMVATLTPGPSYFASCGDAPSFAVRLSVTDLVAASAEPAEANTIATESACSGTFDPDDPCWEDLTLLTAGLAQVTVVSGWSGELAPDLNGTSQALVDTTTHLGVVGVLIDPGPTVSSERRLAVVDFNDPPTVLRVFEPDTEISYFQTFQNFVPAATVDEVNHRAVGYAKIGTSTNVVASVALTPPYDVTTWPIADFCADGCTGTGCGADPATDAAGVVWLPCGRYGDSTLARLDGDGLVTQHDMGLAVDSGSGVPGTTVVVDELEHEWLLWPDDLGVAAIDLATYADATPTVLRAPAPPLWDDARVEGYATRVDRKEAYYAYNQALGGDDMAEVVRVRVVGGVAEMSVPLVFGPKSSSNGSYFHRIILRAPAPAAPVGEADLLISGGDTQEERPMVDTDSWTLLPFPRPAADYDIAYLRELHATSLPDYFVGVVNNNDLKGLVYFPWDPAQSPVEQHVGLPATGDLRPTWISSSPRSRKLIINFKVMSVFDFGP
jgi:hypothetical protein